jgi:RNA polymerase sigma-70 factor (ECF subfamily)
MSPEGDALDLEARQARLELALALALQGDQQAFAEIVQAHQATVFSIAWRYLQDRSAAEDLAQEVFLELYQSLAGIKSAAHLTYWLRRVAVHRCIDHGRRRKHRREQALEETPEPVHEPAEADPLLTVNLQSSLATLTERQRLMVVLRYQEGLGPGEIAELMNVPVNTVKSNLHRSLEELRKKLGRKLGEVRYAFF